jgi:hypothetical protein
MKRQLRGTLFKAGVMAGVVGLLMSASVDTAPAGQGSTPGRVTAASAHGGVDVYVGYADTLRANPANFPTPWDASPNTTFAGCTPAPRCTLDAGAVRVVNNTTTSVTVNSVVVRLGTCHLHLWPSTTLAPGYQLIATQTAQVATGGCNPAGGVMDTSDIGPGSSDWSDHCSPSGVIPAVDVTLDGSMSTFADTGLILNTGGIDKAACPHGTVSNESIQWTRIGSAPCPGAVLSLTPSAQTHNVGEQASLQALLANSCGDPLSNATIEFNAQSGGPNGPALGHATTDQGGVAQLSYSTVGTGTDVVQASVNNPAGTILSNTVTVVWKSPVLTGRAFGLLGKVTLAGIPLVNLPAIADTGEITTTSSSSTSPPCTLNVGGLINAAQLCGNVTTKAAGGQAFSSLATASVADVTISLPGLAPIHIKAVESHALATCLATSGDTTIAMASADGTAIIPAQTPFLPNTTIDLGVLKFILNEQVSSTGPGSRTLTVNAIHLAVPGLADIFLASSTSDIHNC